MSDSKTATAGGAKGGTPALGKPLSRRAATRALLLTPFAGGALASLVGCGGEDGGGDGTEPSGEERSFTLSVGDTPAFDITEMRVGAGDEVTVTITHTGELPATSMGHNFVLLQPGVTPSDFASAAAQATDSGYIPPGREGDIIAHTGLVGGGESDSVTFRARAHGSYKYLCSFPGHFASMQGDFIVS